jgi:dolichyl-phosphooligosaccharide-protein glycotransferase
MDTTSPGWWKRHGWTVGLLLAAFGFAFAIRTIWSYPIIAQFGPLYTYAGGSDSYYHSRVTTYIILTNHNLVFDPMLRFPVGSINPREPLFDWMNAILGLVFAPFFGGNAVVAGAWFLDLQAPLWSALGVFPVYLIGREVSSRRTGLIAALIFPFLSANINSSTFGYANYLSFYTFVILVVVYSYIRTVKAVGNRRWVQSYRDPKQYWPGLKGFLSTERTAVKWAVFTGVGLGALALSWQGYTYAIVVIGVGVLVAMFAERIRKVDSFGLYVATWIIGLIAFPMAAPYYLAQHAFKEFFDVPLLLFFGVLGLLLPFLLMRDIPWVFSIPALVALVGAAALFLRVVLPTYFVDIVTGQGYFVKNLIYSTVAEAQAPSIDALVVGYGVFTFFLAFVGLALFAYLTVHHRFKRYHIVFLVFAVVSIYLPISASKFFLLGSPAFALLAAEAIHRALDVGGYPELRRSVASLADRGGQFGAFRRSFKARHVLVIAVVAVILVPNIWIATDAGIPGNTKNAFADQVANSIPSWLKLNASAPASNYLGAAGSSLDTANQYDSAAYNWLATQDPNVPPPQRPAFVSWWDYGFQAIDQGQHPSVADNFQNGIDPAGQFLLSQNESIAIGVLATTLLQAEQKASGLPYLPAALNQKLVADGVNVTELHNLMVNESQDYDMVVAHPAKYLPVNPDTLTDDNAMYLATSYFLAETLSISSIARVYDDVQAYTGWSIRYAMTDSRLFPFSGTDTGIFYAPADLTGRVISAAGIPTTYFNVTAVSTTGQIYPIGQVPSGVSIAQYQINYSAPFYNTMLYRIYIGYNGTQAGVSGGIPGLSGAAANLPLKPGFMLQHFGIVYRTAYVCAGVKKAQNGSGCFVAQNLPTARQIANQTNGTLQDSALSYFQGGETMLAYYPGQNLLGTLTTPAGGAVPGVRATVYDQWGIPHMSVLTSSSGGFSLVLPPGNDTLNFTTGTFNALNQSGSTVLRTVHIYVPPTVGYSLDAPNLVDNFQLTPSPVGGYIYWNVTGNSSYVPKQDPTVSGARVQIVGSIGVPVLGTVTDASGAFLLDSVPPGVYTYTVTYAGHVYNQTNLTVGTNTSLNATAGLAPANITGTVNGPTGVAFGGASVTLMNATATVESTTSGSSGAFSLPPVAPGKYTLFASSANVSLRSPGIPITVNSTGSSINQTLTLEYMAPVAVEVTSGGSPAAGIAVRFSPEISFQASSRSALGAADAVLSNGTVATTRSDGVASVYVPYGNYSVYALGYVNGVLSAGLGTVDASATGSGATATVNVSRALALRGEVSGGLPLGGSDSAAVVAYGSGGATLVAPTAANGSFVLQLPTGGYDLLGLESTSNPSLPTFAGLSAVRLTAPETTALPLSPAVAVRLAVGTALSSGRFFAAANATVTISAGPSGPGVTLRGTSNGSIAIFLPTTAPLSPTGYCINATAPGFTASQICDLSGTGLSQQTHFLIPLALVPVTLNVIGLPTGNPVTVYFVAESPTAINRTLTGGPSFSLTLPPGNYGVGAEAIIDNGTLVYVPPSQLNTTVPFGATATHLTLLVVPEINATGHLSLPTGLNATNVTITLSSPPLNVTVNGTDFESGFRVAPGTYTASITGTKGSATYANLTRVSVSVGGAVSPKLVLNRAGVRLSGTLETTSFARLDLNTTLSLVGSTGTLVNVAVKNGAFSVVLPPDTTYSAYANASGLVPGENGSFLRNYTTSPTATCTVGANASTCVVSMTSTTVLVDVQGALEVPGGSAPVPGTLRLIGPYPSPASRVVPVPNGTFSVELSPGSYYLYAESTADGPYAAFGKILALPSVTGNATITLGQGWVDSIMLTPSAQPGQSLGLGSLELTDLFGDRATFANLSLGASYPIVLPPGSYTLNGSASGTLNGVSGQAIGNATALVVNGNLATSVTIGIATNLRVSGVLSGAANATVPAGGSATFAFVLRNAGNVPAEVHPVGAPILWQFAFNWTNRTLGPGGSAAGEVTITVPAGTSVNHPPVVLEFETATGEVVGSIEPAPAVDVIPYYGVAIGRSLAHPAQAGTAQVEIPVYVHVTGNAPETIGLEVTSSAALERIGWSYNWLTGDKVVTPPFAGLAAGSNQTYTLNLTTKLDVFVIPKNVSLEATVLDEKGTYTSTALLVVPTGKLGLASGSGAFTVLGAGLGSPSSALPEWAVVPIAFAPAIALLVGVSVYRWWRTRKWTRR